MRLRPVAIAGKRDTVKSQETPDGLPEGCVADPGVVRVLVPLEHKGH